MRPDVLRQQGRNVIRSFGEPPRPRPGYDVPLPNGCWKCIGCGVILPKNSGWNQCGDCDTRTHEDY